MSSVMIYSCMYEGLRQNDFTHSREVPGVCADLWTRCDKCILLGTQTALELWEY